MARFTFKLPDIGEGIAEAEIVAWHVAVGDRVEEDQNIADMMTDKATVEMESPVSGTVVELAGAVGDQVAIGAALVVIETGEAVTDEVVAAPASDAQAETAEQYEAENPGGGGDSPRSRGGGPAAGWWRGVAASVTAGGEAPPPLACGERSPSPCRGGSKRCLPLPPSGPARMTSVSTSLP